jgi:tRNA(Ile)-lysidine synthase
MISTMLVHTLQRDTSLKPGDKLLLAVSGGADSLVLLHALAQAQDQHGLQLHVATLNHGLRASAAEDVRFVQSMAQQLQLPCTAGEFNTLMVVKAGMRSIEAAARWGRYQFLAKTAQTIGASVVATAHHADDQAETVLMHILRGTGLQGMQGMSYTSPLPYYPDLRLIRPMLAMTRAQIEAYCAEHGLEPRHDETNDDTTLLRNKIRHKILPVLAEINPQVNPALVRLADIVKVEQDYMQQQFEREVMPSVLIEKDVFWSHRNGERIRLPISIFRSLHAALQRRFVAWAVKRTLRAIYANDTRDISYERILAACEAAQLGRVGTIIEFSPTMIELRITYTDIVIEPASHQRRDTFQSLKISIPGINNFDEGRTLLVTLEPHENFQAKLAIPAGANAILRTRQAGDRFKPLGMHGKTRKLKDWFIDRKISQSERDIVPLLIINDEIAAIILSTGWFISAIYAVHPASSDVIYCSIIATHAEIP